MLDNIYILTDTELCNRIAAKIKTVRLKQNMSQAELADKSGVSISTIKRMEDGEVKNFESLHGGRGGKELRVADPRPAHPWQARHLCPACRGGAVESERILRISQQSKQAQAQAGIQRLHKRE